MLTSISLIFIIVAFGLLVTLSLVDLKVRLLPNEMVLGFFTCGAIFHVATWFTYVSAIDAAMGAVAGFCSLYLVRTLANAIYKDDAMGLGDVKLVGAGGLWVGIDGIFLVIAIGAFAGVLHGLVEAFVLTRRERRRVHLSELSVPAGPGFALGIALVTGWTITDFFMSLFDGSLTGPAAAVL